MKNTYYYIVTLAMLILAFPVKAASEAEFGKSVSKKDGV